MESEGGIVMYLKGNPEQKIRERTKKFANSYIRVAFSSLLLSILTLLLMAFWKDDIQAYALGREDDWTGLSNFFALDNNNQWAIVFGINGWSLFEVLLTLALKGFVNHESCKWLQIWLVVDCIDCVFAGLALLTLLFYVAMVTKVVLGIVVLLASVYEIYFLKTLLKFIEIISNSHVHSDDEDDAYA